jgi:hypothetical protein
MLQANRASIARNFHFISKISLTNADQNQAKKKDSKHFLKFASIQFENKWLILNHTIHIRVILWPEGTKMLLNKLFGSGEFLLGGAYLLQLRVAIFYLQIRNIPFFN